MIKDPLIVGLYTVQKFESKDNIVTATIKLHKEHEVFKGHFPGNPIMPGVCMVQMIKELAEKTIGKELFLSIVSNVKFMAIINPEKNDTIQLVLDVTEDEGLVKVRNTVHFEDTLALKLNATFKIID